jgi:hypothetical protein
MRSITGLHGVWVIIFLFEIRTAYDEVGPILGSYRPASVGVERCHCHGLRDAVPKYSLTKQTHTVLASIWNTFGNMAISIAYMVVEFVISSHIINYSAYSMDSFTVRNDNRHIYAQCK